MRRSLLTSLFLATVALAPSLALAQPAPDVSYLVAPKFGSHLVISAIIYYFVERATSIQPPLLKVDNKTDLKNVWRIPPEHLKIRQQGELLKANFPVPQRLQSYWSLSRT